MSLVWNSMNHGNSLVSATTMENEIQNSGKDRNKQRRSLWRDFFIYNFGMFLVSAAYSAIFNLQSSINIEDSLGTTSMGISYMVSILFALFVSPVMIRLFGAKKCIIAGDVGYLLYVIANFYPAYSTLLTGGIAVAFAEATIWPAISIMNVYMATKLSLVDSKSRESYIILLSGYFFMIYQTNQIFGNLVSYAFLYAYKLPVSKNNSLNCGNNSHCELLVNLTYCGINDCQDEIVIGQTLNQYRPVNELSIYALIVTLSVLIIVAIFLHAKFLPNIERSSKNAGQVSAQDNVGLENLTRENEVSPSLELFTVETTCENGEVDQSLLEREEQIVVTKDPKQNLVRESCTIVSQTLRCVMRQFIKPKQLLLMMLTIYNGMAMGFAFSELTRSFASCVLGVEWVGICMVVFGCSDCLMSWFVGKYGKKIGYLAMYTIGFSIEIANYSYCLLWTPRLDSSWSIYVVSFTFGMVDGIIQTLLNVTYIEYFPEDQDVALSVWNLFVIGGLAIQISISRLFCLDVKVYVNLFFLIVGFFSTVCAVFVHQREEGNKDKK